MLTSWLLAIPYLGALSLLLGLAWVLGRPAAAYIARDTATLPGSGFFALAVGLSFGLALISQAGALAGIALGFYIPIVCAMLTVLFAVSTWWGYRVAAPEPLLARDTMRLRDAWQGAGVAARLLGGVLGGLLVLLSINSLIGAMVPDMNHDPMWYHLSVPQQWIFDREFGVYGSVMPSAYPLAVESIYAILLLIKMDSVICSLLHAATGVLLNVAMLSACRMALADHPRAGWGVGAMAALWIPAISGYGMLAPLQPKNDFVVMLWAFTGSMVLWVPLLAGLWDRSLGVKTVQRRDAAATLQHTLHQWIIGGVLLGTACNGKPIVLGIAGLVFVAAVVVQTRVSTVRDGAKLAGVCLLAMGGTSVLWMWRGYSTHGLPLFPLGQGLFHVAPAFQPLMDAFNREHGLPGTVATGWVSHVLALPRYMTAGGRSGEIAIFLMAATALLGIVAGRGVWRIYALMLAAQMLILASGKGLLVTFRFMAPAYCLAAPLTAYLAASTAARLRPGMRLLTAVLLSAAMWASVANKQRLIAMTPTLKWDFRPMLSEADVRAFASHAELGGTYLLFSQVREIIPRGQRVLLLGSHYPFYLHRDTIWNDEVVDHGGVEQQWQQASAEEAEAFLRDEGVWWVFYASDGVSKSTAEQLTERGMLEKVELPAGLRERGWGLYRRLGGR